MLKKQRKQGKQRKQRESSDLVIYNEVLIAIYVPCILGLSKEIKNKRNMSKEMPNEQNKGKEGFGPEIHREWENKKKMYKESPGLYREWGMKVVNKVVAKLEDEYTQLKTLRYDIKQAWVMDVVIILMQETEDSQNPITEEQLKVVQGRLEDFVERRIKRFFDGEEKLDELLWEQEMESK